MLYGVDNLGMICKWIVDTSGFIHGDDAIFHRAALGQTENGSAFYIYTSPLVVQEIRDARARKRLKELESVLIVKEPNSLSIKAGIESLLGWL